MKAQMEFIVILAMIIIAIVVIMVSSNLAVTDSDNPLITGIGEEKKTVKDSVLNSISSLVRSELREIYKNGGGEFSGNTVTYGVKEIGIWKDCDKSEVPNIKTILERGIESRIEKIFKSEMDFFGKEVRFDLDKLDISVNIQSNGVKFDVEMPTKFEGSDVPQPYSVMVPSRLKEIIEISDTITKNSDNSDFFESATLNTILFSNPEEKWMPTVDLITGCGNAFFKTDKDTLESIESTLKYTASHIVYDKEILNSGENPFYVLGISDLDIDVSFIYPEDWELGKNLAVKPSPSAFYAKPILSFSSACIETTDVRYSVRYPVIVMIKDDALHEIFNFAVMVNIDENKPGCGFGKSKGSSYHEKCVTESECFANVDVKDKNGMPVSNALVTFGGCSIGETDYSGFTSSPIPCMIGEVSIQKQGYSEHKKLVKSGDMSSYSVVMESGGKKIPVHFYGVPLKRGKSVAIGEYKDYTVESQPRSISLFPGNYFVLVYLEHDNGEKIMLYNIGSDGFTGSSEAFIEPGFYSTFAAAVSKEYEITVGYIDSKYLSSGDEDKLYVYVPFVEGQTADSIKSTETSKIQATLNKCGIKAVSSSEQIVNIPCG